MNDPDNIFFKPRSRTTNEWVPGYFNGVRTVMSIKGVRSKEYAFLANDPGKAMLDRGDSGSIIFDKELYPVAMLWGGKNYDFSNGPRDLTYASPLLEIIKDIEAVLGQSVSWIWWDIDWNNFENVIEIGDILWLQG